MIKNMKMSVKWCQVLKDKNSRICERFFASTCVKVYFVKLSESENYKSDVIESKLESDQNENDRSGSTRRFRCWTSNLQSILIFKIENSQGQSAGVWRAGRLTLVENRRLQKQSQLYKNQQVKNQT